MNSDRSGRRLRASAAWATTLLASLFATAHGQVPGPAGATGAKFHPEASYNAEALLRSAAGHARDGQWAEAVEIYRRVIDQFGGGAKANTVTQVPRDDPAADPTGESRLYVDVRRYCQRQIAAMPAEGRALYRNRVDAEAERWYREGLANRDRALLRRVVDEAFCSSWGDDALELLGDLAFQDGRFAEALSAYRQLVPEPEAAAGTLMPPDPSIDPARVAAKALLARAAAGEDPPGPADLAAYRQAFPEAKGSLAGRTGPLSQVVAKALDEDHLALPTQPDGRWPTFAGAPTRSRVAPGAVDVGSKQWSYKLDPVPQPRGNDFNRFNRTTATAAADRLLAFHPIVLGDQVVVCDDDQIIALNLNARTDDRAGTPAEGAPEGVFAWDQKLHTQQYANNAGRGGANLPHYSLTASGDRIFARLGSQTPGQPSMLIAVRNNREVEGKRIWEINSADIELPRQGNAAGRRPVFEGSPVADARNVYIGLTEINTPMTANYVACLDAETGDVRWVRYLGDANPEFDPNMGIGMPAAQDVGGRLLSLDGPTVYYQTNMGALAALEAETGQVRWLATYPHRERNDLASSRPRDLNPAVVHGGLVIIAPDDSPWIFAYDAATGRLAWKSDRQLPEVAFLLGVVKGKLFATGDHVWTIDAANGRVLRCWPDGPGLEGYGRGLLAGDQVYWPTRTEIRVLDQATGVESDRGPIALQKAFGTGGGNLAVGDGYLVVAQADQIVVYCQNSRLIERFREEIAHSPNRAAPYVRLARVAEATGDDELALTSLAGAIKHARPSETFDGQPLADSAWGGLHRILMRLGRKAAGGGDWSGARDRFAAAVAAARIGKDRLDASLRLAEAQAQAGDARTAVATLQKLLSEPALRSLTVAVDLGRTRTVRADLLIADRLDALIRERGRDLYADYDRKARDLLDRGRREGDARLLEEVGRTYPVAAAAPDALLALAELHMGRDRPDEAARALKRLLAADPDDEHRARALIALADAYEAQQLLIPAREAYARAVARAPNARLDESGRTVADVVRERLARPSFLALAEQAGEPSLPVPLSRRWSIRLKGSVRPLAADGLPPSADAARIFLADGKGLRAVDPADGRAPWTADLGDEPVWVGYLADRLLAATEGRIVALDLARGSVEWRYPPEDPGPLKAAVNPFAKAGAEPEGDRAVSPAAAPLHGFRIVGGRVFCFRGNRELVALDGDTGLVDWSYAPAGGTLGAHAWIGHRRVVLQARRPNLVVVLETERGRAREYGQDDDEPEWGRDPLPISDDQVALAVDAQTIALFDLNRGEAAWSYRDKPDLPYGSPPRLLGDSGALLALFGGSTLVRLDPANGQRVWGPVPLGLDGLDDEPDALAIDADRVYCASGGEITALALADGQPAWRRFLAGPKRGWSLSLAEGCLVAHPNPGRATAGPLEELPLVVCRRDDGALIQRLVFSASVSALAVRLAPRGALVASQAEVWSVGAR